MTPHETDTTTDPTVDPSVAATVDAVAARASSGRRPELLPVAERETALAPGRLAGELTRTTVQLRILAAAVRDGRYLDARIDHADADAAPAPRPDIRRYLVPVGPVLNFAASNFPFAFSVAGGDTASALAVGCPVVVKAHPGHPELSRLVAEAASAALVAAGLPEGTLQLVEGEEAGLAMLRDPRIRAATFTGSLRAGRFLADVAAARPDPIPFFGELGSVNPVVITERAAAERGEDIAAALVASAAGSAGQLCTAPGIVLIPAGHGLDAVLAEEAGAVAPHGMLNARIAEGYADGRAAAIAVDGVRLVAEGRAPAGDDGSVTPTVAAVSLADFEAAGDALRHEVFGPFALLVEYPAGTDLAALAARTFTGELTASVHLGADEAEAGGAATADLIRVLAARAGRVLVDAWPTGVSVTDAQQHGGPWPATTLDRGTSVGTASLDRLLRGVAFQGVPDALLPEPLRTANPWGASRVGERGAPVGAPPTPAAEGSHKPRGPRAGGRWRPGTCFSAGGGSVHSVAGADGDAGAGELAEDPWSTRRHEAPPAARGDEAPRRVRSGGRPCRSRARSTPRSRRTSTAPTAARTRRAPGRGSTSRASAACSSGAGPTSAARRAS
ncbi:Alpha-ketoglutaric semialdehyde dehydrogenase [Clavibacter michiganensis subsp. michiganensis]|uniref:aldehyde dehydrogenase family protein n=1 Tax=Clavibacter michiganensis TaxID=28447 RepID=UPI000B76698C|nr:Alpha-ketoglutaric semialdehyde dehydrogenase [Clavibacter michiganensis subsp. michiganensis]